MQIPTTMMFASIAAFGLGIILLIISNKKRDENGEWSSPLQWGYLLAVFGTFDITSYWISFTAILLIFLVITGVLWIKQRKWKKSHPNILSKNHFADYMSGFFPVIFIIFVVRSFIVEPFQIPSSSMRPGLIVGDFILVNKFSYGLRIPITNKVFIPTGHAQRGDVVVFNYPENPSINYIKRLIGLPGDTIEYRHKKLRINNQEIFDQPLSDGYRYVENIPNLGAVEIQTDKLQENLDKKQFDIIHTEPIPPVLLKNVRQFPYHENCHYYPDGSGFQCRVPEGYYFMMGDNRDNSEDSRYWGFVKDDFLVGKAFLIWLNMGQLNRMGTPIK